MESWEDMTELEEQMKQLRPPSPRRELKPLPRVGDGSAAAAAAAAVAAAGEGPPLIEQLEDQFLRDALVDNRNRMTVLKVELEMEKFLKGAAEQLRFTMQLTSYQRAAIHRVASFYQMQSEKVVLDDDPLAPGHILIRKTQRTKAPLVRLADYKTVEQHRKAAELSAAPRVMGIKRREKSGSDADLAALAATAAAAKAAAQKTVEQREQDYANRRAQLFNEGGGGGAGSGSDGEAAAAKGTESPAREEASASSSNGEGRGGGGGGGGGGSGGKGRQRRAILHDRDVDRLDPDFARSSSPRFASNAYDQCNPYDQYGGGYRDGHFSHGGPQSYNNEFPSLGGGNNQFPPLPPGLPPGAQQPPLPPTMMPYVQAPPPMHSMPHGMPPMPPPMLPPGHGMLPPPQYEYGGFQHCGGPGPPLHSQGGPNGAYAQWSAPLGGGGGGGGAEGEQWSAGSMPMGSMPLGGGGHGQHSTLGWGPPPQ